MYTIVHIIVLQSPWDTTPKGSVNYALFPTHHHHGKDLDILLPFVCCSAEALFELHYNALLPHIHVTSTFMVNKLMLNNYWTRVRARRWMLWRNTLGTEDFCITLVRVTVWTISQHIEVLYSWANGKWFASIYADFVFSASPYHHFIYIFNKSYFSTWKRVEMRTGDSMQKFDSCKIIQQYSAVTEQKSISSQHGVGKWHYSSLKCKFGDMLTHAFSVITDINFIRNWHRRQIACR